MNSLPSWIKRKTFQDVEAKNNVEEVIKTGNLNTVCTEANCPNKGECWAAGTATFMIMGEVCTRNCRFCDVHTGSPAGKLNRNEPNKIKDAAKELELDYVVLTSVDRDDLADGGAGFYAACIDSLKNISKPPLVEALIPDFSGEKNSLKKILNSNPDVIGHNVETVERLSDRIRDPRARYSQSIELLRSVKELRGEMVTKSSIILGLGEKESEIEDTMRDLYGAGVDILTLGQYLRPSKKQVEVERFWKPEKFKEFQELAHEIGFSAALAGPFVRSSYKAKELYEQVSK